MGLSAPLLISAWLLAQQPAAPNDRFDLDGRDFAAQSVGSRGFLNVGPVPVASTFALGEGEARISASERLGDSSATYGDRAEVEASLRIGLDEITIQLTQTGFPPLAGIPAELGREAVPKPPQARIGGGVQIGGWVHGDGASGFMWGPRAPAAFSVFGFGRISVNGIVLSERAIIQAHALTAGRFSDDDSHLLQPGVREGDLELQIIVTNLPRSIVPNGFVELHFDEVRIGTPEGEREDVQVEAEVAGVVTGPQAPLPLSGATSLVFTLPAELPGVGGSGFIDSSGDALSGSGALFGTSPDPSQLGFLSGTGPAFGTPPTPEPPTGDFSGEGPVFDPAASPEVAPGATGAEPVADGARTPAPTDPAGAEAPPGTTAARPGETTPTVPVGPDLLFLPGSGTPEGTTSGVFGQTTPEVGGGPSAQTTPQMPGQTSVVTPGVSGPITPGTPVRGEVVGATPGAVDALGRPIDSAETAASGAAVIGGSVETFPSPTDAFGTAADSATGGAGEPSVASTGVDSSAGSAGSGASQGSAGFGPGESGDVFGPGASGERFGPGVAGESFGPGGSGVAFGPGATRAPSGGIAQRSDVFVTVPESTPGVPATPFALNAGTDLPQRVVPQNAAPAIPNIRTVQPANAQPATPFPQGIAPLNASPAGSTPPPPSTSVPVAPAATPAQ